MLQFLTVFLGAFLAFWLENLRERQQLKTWVRKNLKASYDELSLQQAEEAELVKHFPNQLEVYAKFYQGNVGDITEDDWEVLGRVFYSFSKDTSSLLEGEALRVIDPVLAKTLLQKEKSEFALLKVSELWSTFHDNNISTVCIERRLPLSEQEKDRSKRFTRWACNYTSTARKISRLARTY